MANVELTTTGTRRKVRAQSPGARYERVQSSLTDGAVVDDPSGATLLDVRDDDVRLLLTELLTEQRIIRAHLEQITDQIITEDDVS